MVKSSKLDHKQIRDKIDNYESTIQGLQAFHKAISWRNSAVVEHEHSFCRRMTLNQGSIPDNERDVTPDLVVQIASALGYVIEAKRSLPKNQEHWGRVIDQLQKYDTSLIGWWTENELVPTSNTVLLIWTKFLTEFAAYLDDKIEKGLVRFQGPVSLVEFSKIQETTEIVFLRRDWGTVIDQEMTDELTRGISIPLEQVIGAAERQLKFYDDPPETEYVMTILWNDILTSKLPELKYDKTLKAWPVEVTVTGLTSELQRLFGSAGNETRERKFPREAWIRKALEAFIALNLAERLDSKDSYLVKYKTTLRTGVSGDLIDIFSRHRLDKPGKERAPKQLQLFENHELSEDTSFESPE